jgi:hypothetical protein
MQEDLLLHLVDYELAAVSRLIICVWHSTQSIISLSEVVDLFAPCSSETEL